MFLFLSPRQKVPGLLLQSPAAEPDWPLPRGLSLLVSLWPGEELPTLRRPPGGLHSPAAEPSRACGGAAVVLRRRRPAVRSLPPGENLHAPGQRASLSPVLGARRGRRPGQVRTGHRAQPLFHLR